MDIEKLVRAFERSMLFFEVLHETDEIDEEREDKYVAEVYSPDDIPADVDEKIREFCRTFVQVESDYVDVLAEDVNQTGSDLYLSMAGHGSGLWDDYGKPWQGKGKEIHRIAEQALFPKSRTEFYCYVEDGKFGIEIF